MPARSTRKVNIYKWHRMKKKLISSVVSVLCCLVVMMVGVYASTSNAYQIAIANDIDVKIIAVDGTLFARRRGGVWATPEENESAYGNAITEADDFTDLSDPEGFKKIYDKEYNIHEEAMTSLCQKIDINVYNNEIEYVFKYVIEEGSLFSTIVRIVNGPESTIKPGGQDADRIECSYKYAFSTTEPDWNTVTSKLDVDGINYVEVKDHENYRCVYIRAYLKYNTEEYGKTLSSNESEAARGLGYKGKWQFSLVLEEFENLQEYKDTLA